MQPATANAENAGSELDILPLPERDLALIEARFADVVAHLRAQNRDVNPDDVFEEVKAIVDDIGCEAHKPNSRTERRD